MKITPLTPQPSVQSGQPQSAQDAKQRAVSAFMNASQPQQAVVQDQSSISPEEFSAVQTPKSTGQTDINEGLEETQQAETPEVKAEPKQEETALSRQFAQLARQERALRAKAQQQEQAIKAREDALKAREAQMSSQSEEYKTKYFAKDLLKQDPLAALAEAGISYDDLTQRILNQPASDPRMEATVNALKAEIESLRSGIDESKKSYAESQTQAYQAAVKQIKTDATHLITSDPAFETVKAMDSVQDVVDLITQTYDKDGILLSIEDAAQQVEDYLVEEAMKIASLDKIKKRLGQVSSATPAQSTPQQTQVKDPKQPQQMKTLTNATGVPRKLSAKERALLAFRGELKS